LRLDCFACENESVLDFAPVWLSVKVALAALGLSFVLGTLAARLMSGRDFPLKTLLDGVFLLPLVLPPVVTGYVLLLLLGRNGLIGRELREHGVQVLFTPSAAVIASAVVAFPLMYGAAKAAFLSLDAHLLDAAASLGAAPARIFFTIAVPLAWPGLIAGAVLSFARAFGEFGATVMVAGSIQGRTATIPVMIYNASEAGDLRTAGVYAALSGLLNLGFIVGVNLWTRHRIKTR
jgi:molybdate transport system permease protein